jgi:plastocyanin
MKIFTVFLFVVGMTLSPTSHAADITGVITFKGTPPPEATNTLIMDDSNCGQLYSVAPTTHFYVVGPKGGFADVVVSLKGVPGQAASATAPPMVMDQKNCLYVPTILAIQTGQKLVVKNSDQCVHNVHSVPTVAGNEEHNDPQMPGGADLTYTFSQPEKNLKFKCDVHPWMFAWVTVVDSPYFCVSDKTGKFTIKNVPPGKYTLEATHRKLGAQTQEIEVKDGEAIANFTFETK